MFFKWIFKTFCAVLIVTNTWNIVMGIFDVGQSVVNQSAGVIIGETAIDIDSVITDMEAQLEALSTGELFGLWFQSLFVGLTMNALSICIMLVIYGRMIEVYLTTSIGPIPLATMTNRDWASTGQNYLKSLFALAFQAFLIMVCVGIYSVLVQSIATDGNLSGAIWACMGYPYVWGGSSPSTSFDCSGFVSWVINHSGWSVGRQTAQGLYNLCTPVSSAQAKPGDLIFFVGTYDTAGVSHVGIYVGGGMMIHCGDPISYADVNTSYWQSHYFSFGRLP